MTISKQSNGSYISFARKYRPASFAELSGQEVLTKTLTYCINNNRLSQVHLLSGIRGVGKTSSARIIAKTVNCENPAKSDHIISPCNLCKNCESFNNQNHPDIVEIDAASRTGVDDVREIIESSEYKPLLGKYKFFIIDEVHMLSKNAFNALLKLIEEPPAYVIFIFATTEVQKIPITVISRCQRYDLRRLSFDEIYNLLTQIAQKENINFEEEALRIISIKSEGSARDAVSILDQAASYLMASDQNDIITTDLVNKMLGLVQLGTIVRLLQLIIANDPNAAIKLLGEIYANSSNLEQLLQNFADFLAELAKSKVIRTYNNPLYQSYKKEITDLLIGTSLSRITSLWQIFSKGLVDIKHSHNELLLAEMLVIKAIYACNLPKIEDLLSEDFKPEMHYNINAQPESTQQQNFRESSNEEDKKVDIWDFLKYCHANKERAAYYFLMNDVEIKNFALPNLDIIITKPENEIIDSLKDILFSWSNIKWNISTSRQNSIVSLKEKMLEEAKASEDFQIIKKKFPESNISDIILKNQN